VAEVALAASGQVQQGGAVGGASTRGAGPSATSGSTDASSAAGGAPQLLRGVLVHRSRASPTMPIGGTGRDKENENLYGSPEETRPPNSPPKGRQTTPHSGLRQRISSVLGPSPSVAFARHQDVVVRGRGARRSREALSPGRPSGGRAVQDAHVLGREELEPARARAGRG